MVYSHTGIEFKMPQTVNYERPSEGVEGVLQLGDLLHGVQFKCHGDITLLNMTGYPV